MEYIVAARVVGDSLFITNLLSLFELSHASRALFFILVGNLGFRSAPPQALCYRPAPRAKTNPLVMNLIGVLYVYRTIITT